MKKPTEFFLTTVLVAIFLFGLPRTSFATLSGYQPVEIYYDTFINNVKITSENCGDVLGDGTVSFDNSTSTLTLNGATISKSKFMGINGAHGEAFIGSLRELTINLIGNNTIDMSDHYTGYSEKGVFCPYLKITGEGELTITGGAYSSAGIFTNSFTMENATLNIEAQGYGIETWNGKSSDGMTVKSGNLTVIGSSGAIDMEPVNLAAYKNCAVSIGSSVETASLCYVPTAVQLKENCYVKIGPGFTISVDQIQNNISVEVSNQADLPLSASLFLAAYNTDEKMIDIQIFDVNCPSNSEAIVAEYSIPSACCTVKTYLLDIISNVPISVSEKWMVLPR